MWHIYSQCLVWWKNDEHCIPWFNLIGFFFSFLLLRKVNKIPPFDYSSGLTQPQVVYFQWHVFFCFFYVLGILHLSSSSTECSCFMLKGYDPQRCEQVTYIPATELLLSTGAAEFLISSKAFSNPSVWLVGSVYRIKRKEIHILSSKSVNDFSFCRHNNFNLSSCKYNNDKIPKFRLGDAICYIS